MMKINKYVCMHPCMIFYANTWVARFEKTLTYYLWFSISRSTYVQLHT